YLYEYSKQTGTSRVAAFDRAVKLGDTLSKGQIAAMIAPLYQNSGLGDEQTRLGWIGKKPADFENSSDPFIQLAVELYETNLKFEEESEELAGLLAQARPDYMRAIIAYNKSLGKPVYPDANSTLRISYGSVGGYPARDGVYKTPFTTVKGMIAKHTGEAPFNVPKKVMDTYNAGNVGPYRYENLDRKVKTCSEADCYKPRPTKLNSVPVNFLSSADTTGGNSGSPVMNGKGELVGLNFDSTYESITKDWYFNADITRAIHVDIRYVLWLLEHVEKADNLINEMTINRG
ncbi:MAG: S46 family peptidase, partial [Algicola sp.]|nr:S46 family peptidase [Algicola sp.]